MPDLREESRTPWHSGPRLAIAIAVVAVAVPLVLATMWASLGTRTPVDEAAATADLFSAAGATAVAVVSDDETVLRGYLWQGGSHGVVLTQGFGSDSTSIVRLATAAHREGATVLLFEPRGTGQSEGEANPLKLEPDMRAAVADLTTRGVTSVSIMAFRHSGTALFEIVADPMPELRDAVAVFPFVRYQNLDAGDSLARAKVPITLVGVQHPSPSGPAIYDLAALAPEAATVIYDYPGDAVPLLDATMDNLLDLVRQHAR